jgi:sRNA-binding protein
MPPLARAFALLAGALALMAVAWVGRYSPLATLSRERLKAEEEQARQVTKRRPQQIADDRKEHEKSVATRPHEDAPKVAGKPPYPKVETDARIFDFGTMDVGETGRHKFTIRNVGKAPLILKLAPAPVK